jgi:uncharacterized lipoprotein
MALLHCLSQRIGNHPDHGGLLDTELHGDRVVGSPTLDTGASAFIVGAPFGHIWQRCGESFEAFEMRVKAAAEEAKAPS